MRERTADMMLRLYVTPGISLLLAARSPSANRSLIDPPLQLLFLWVDAEGRNLAAAAGDIG